MSKLKPYMIFSRSAGHEQCAGLAFALNHKQARRIGWQSFAGEITDEYTDLAANIIRGCKWLLEEADAIKLVNNEAHCTYPKSCKRCEHWGHSPIGDDGICYDCKSSLDV